MPSLILLLVVVVSVLMPQSLTAQLSFMPASVDRLRSRESLPNGASLVVPPDGLVAALRSDGAVTFQMPFQGRTIGIRGEGFRLFTHDAVLVDRGDNGDVVTDLPEHGLFRGSIDGMPGSSVFVAAFPTHVVGIINIAEPEGTRRYLISPDTIISGRVATHVVYEVRPGMGSPKECHAETLPEYQRQSDSIFQMVSAWERAKGAGIEVPDDATRRVLQLALDCTFSFYRNLGSNLATAAQSAIAIIGADAMVFGRDANVIIRVPYLRVWTTTDPYPGEIGEKLGRVRDHWNNNMKHVNRSVTCLLSGEGGGGLAWVGVLCSGYGYNVSGVDGRVNFPVPGYQWDVDVTSHELGHNIGSSHTHNCGWNPPIDSCWNAEGGCYDGTRTRRGTIMSYCHLQSMGTELQLHPRVASLFNRVLANTGCTGPEPTQQDTDVAVVDIRMPINGATVISATKFTPEAFVKNLGRRAVTNVTVRCALTRLDNTVSKAVSATIARIEPGQSQLVVFPSTSLDTVDRYLARVAIDLPSDKFSTNNIITRPFRVAARDSGSVRVTSPNGGETLVSGSVAKIQFTATSAPTVMIDYSTDSGAEWRTVQRSVESSKGSYDWTVPFTPSRTCLVRIRSTLNSAASDVSDAVFTIATERDAQAYDIVEPGIDGTITTPLTPRVVIRNNGALDMTDVSVRLTMRWNRATVPTYDTTIVVPVLKGLQQDTLILPASAVLANGIHFIEMNVESKQDVNTSNNRFWREFSAKGLTPPSDVRLEAGPNRMIVSWNLREVEPTMRVELWRGDDQSGLQRVRTLRPTVTTYVDDDLVNGRRYFYSLRVVKGSLISVFTPVIGERPMAYTAGNSLKPPVVISPVDGTQGVPGLADLVWGNVDGADQYEINVANDASFQDLEEVFVVRDPGAIMVPFDFGVTRRWRVRALNQTFNGPWSNTATFLTTKNCAGSALTFDGNGQRASDGTLTWDGGPVTVEYWTYVKRSTLRPTSTFMIGESDNAGNRFQAHAPWEDGRIYWDYGDIGGKGRISVPFGDQNYDRWTHVALVSNGSTFKAIYINGELVAKADDAAEPKGLKRITIGGSVANQWHFNGMVDEFRIWNVARSAEDIQMSMSRRMPLPADNARIVGWWRCDEGSGATARDAVRARTLTLSAATMWTPSEAGVNCDDPSIPSATSFTAGTGTAPAIRSHVHDVSWKATSVNRGTVWYQLHVTDTSGSSVLMDLNNITAAPGSSVVTTSLRGLPADSMMLLRVRAHSTYGTGPWTTATLKTLTPCTNNTVTLDGSGIRLTSENFLYNGRATTVEYWSLVDQSQLMNSVSFMVGTQDNEANRFQAHAPWGDRNLYWDIGNWREAGRLSTSYEKNLGKWTHVALVSNGQDSMSIYYNGVLAAKSGFAGTTGDLRQLTIGGNPFSRTYWKGSIRDFRVWNTMRSEQQIRASMFDRITEPRSGLLGAWLMDEGKGLRAFDITYRSGPARSDVEFRWDTTSAKLPHAGAVVRGRRIVQRGDTAEYEVREIRDARNTWSVVGGVLQSDPSATTALVKWNATDSAGALVLRRTWPGGCTDETRVPVTLPVLVSVDDERAGTGDDAETRVMPNPASEHVRIDVPTAASLEVMDVHGRLVLRKDLIAGRNDIDVHEFAQGSYYVRIIRSSSISSHPLMIRR